MIFCGACFIAQSCIDENLVIVGHDIETNYGIPYFISGGTLPENGLLSTKCNQHSAGNGNLAQQ
jgi:hypothetical protein